jgi:uncharacterized membrane protein
MRRAVDQIIELIQFAGVAVAFVGVVVTVVRAGAASIAGGRRARINDIGLDLARIILVALDLMLVAAILAVAMVANELTFTRLATIAGLRIGLTLLVSFEDAYRTDTGDRFGGLVRGGWPKRLGRARDVRSAPRVVAGDRPVAENVWPDRARLGRDWHRSAG